MPSVGSQRPRLPRPVGCRLMAALAGHGELAQPGQSGGLQSHASRVRILHSSLVDSQTSPDEPDAYGNRFTPGDTGLDPLVGHQAGAKATCVPPVVAGSGPDSLRRGAGQCRPRVAGRTTTSSARVAYGTLALFDRLAQLGERLLDMQEVRGFEPRGGHWSRVYAPGPRGLAGECAVLRTGMTGFDFVKKRSELRSGSRPTVPSPGLGNPNANDNVLANLGVTGSVVEGAERILAMGTDTVIGLPVSDLALV